jgi:hypothetical protein
LLEQFLAGLPIGVGKVADVGVTHALDEHAGGHTGRARAALGHLDSDHIAAGDEILRNVVDIHHVPVFGVTDFVAVDIEFVAFIGGDLHFAGLGLIEVEGAAEEAGPCRRGTLSVIGWRPNPLGLLGRCRKPRGP